MKRPCVATPGTSLLCTAGIVPLPPVIRTSCKSSRNLITCTSIEYDISSGCYISTAAKPAQSSSSISKVCSARLLFCCLLHQPQIGHLSGLLCIMSTAARPETALGPCSAHSRISTVKYNTARCTCNPTCQGCWAGPPFRCPVRIRWRVGVLVDSSAEVMTIGTCPVTSSWVVAHLVHARTSRQHCHRGHQYAFFRLCKIGMKTTRKN
jgi:hypothetical protein